MLRPGVLSKANVLRTLGTFSRADLLQLFDVLCRTYCHEADRE
jgi:hypothetical protein